MVSKWRAFENWQSRDLEVQWVLNKLTVNRGVKISENCEKSSEAPIQLHCGTLTNDVRVNQYESSTY